MLGPGACARTTGCALAAHRCRGYLPPTSDFANRPPGDERPTGPPEPVAASVPASWPVRPGAVARLRLAERPADLREHPGQVRGRDVPLPLPAPVLLRGLPLPRAASGARDRRRSSSRPVIRAAVLRDVRPRRLQRRERHLDLAHRPASPQPSAARMAGQPGGLRLLLLLVGPARTPGSPRRWRAAPRSAPGVGVPARHQPGEGRRGLAAPRPGSGASCPRRAARSACTSASTASTWRRRAPSPRPWCRTRRCPHACQCPCLLVVSAEVAERLTVAADGGPRGPVRASVCICTTAHVSLRCSEPTTVAHAVATSPHPPPVCRQPTLSWASPSSTTYQSTVTSTGSGSPLSR